MKIYHNPRCSKSRATLELLRNKDQDPEVIEYLKKPPTPEELRDIIKKLGVSAEAIVRKGEDVYKNKFEGKAMDEDAWIKALIANPILIERPIVVSGKQAAIGRPPKNVLHLL
ncbi:MAG: arsenate reductase (glutaredoxin) [bacterium]|nr:arsenate reductase (glutaredoxin) [bacterium]